MRLVLAHEKWFIDASRYPLRFDLMFKPEPMAFMGGVLVLTMIAWFVWSARGRKGFIPGPLKLGAQPERLCGFYGLMPAILAIHFAMTLLVCGTQRTLFSPNNLLTGGWGYFISLALVGCALAIFYGAGTRIAAAVLVLLWLVGLPYFGLQAMLDNLPSLGLAGFFFLAGRGPIALDRLIFPRLEPSQAQMARAVTVMRAGLGLGLAIVAFTEKFANLPMADAFLHQYEVNFTPWFGLSMSNQTFVCCAGSVELLAGLWLALGIFQREIVLIAWMPINISLSYFNWNSTELIGHLPLYGMMAVLLIWAPDGTHIPYWLRGMREGPLAIPPA